MKQVVSSARSGKLSLQDVPPPKAKRGHLLVATRASVISTGTERSANAFAKKSLVGKAQARPDLVRKVLDKARRDGILATMNAVLARLDEPMPLGYSAAGRVVEVGQGLEGHYRVGDRVAIAGAGLANHAALNVVPENLVAPIPADVPDEEAAFCTLGAIALHAVRNCEPRLGERVAVIGAGLVGQLAAQLLSLAGARVLSLDYNQDRLDLAAKLGAELTLNLGNGSPEETVLSWTDGLGCDAVLIAAATKSSEPFATAAAIARDRARVCLVGLTGTEFSYRDFMQKELLLVVSRSYGPGRYDADYEGKGVKYPPGFVRWTETANLGEVVRLMSPTNLRRLDVAALITHRYDFADAEKAYAMIMAGEEPHLGVVLGYSEGASETLPKVSNPAVKPSSAGGCRLAVVGAGGFARTMLLPKLKGMAGVSLETIVTTRGMSAAHSQEAFGFAHATTDLDDVLQDPNIDALLIATPHASHARLTVQALAAGKHAFVEKPLALSREELAQVAAARAESDAFFTVGFNRRFAPMVRDAKSAIASTPEAKVLLFRVNAGALPDDAAINDAEEGGGRILGESCHFIDLARYLVGQPIVGVDAQAAQVGHGVCDDLAISLRFQDGSLATILYTSKGDPAYSKERFEIFVGGRVIAIDNFLESATTVDGRTTTRKARAGQDKGHKAELQAFVKAVASGTPPVDENELLESSLATIAVLESLRSGRSVSLIGDAESSATDPVPDIAAANDAAE